ALMTTILPAWLEKTPKGPRIVPERAAAIKRIFALAKGGLGGPRIVAALQAEGGEPFGSRGVWTPAYVGLILSDRRVCGEYQPRTAGGQPEGAAIPGYLPRIVSEEEWALARAATEKRQGTDRRGRKVVRGERKYVNTFRGLLTCA